MQEIVPPEWGQKPMGMPEPFVFSLHDCPGRKLKVEQLIDRDMRHHEGMAYTVKQQAARAMAEAIMKDEKFWHWENQPRYLLLEGDAIVMTLAEVKSFALAMYERGKESAIYR